MPAGYQTTGELGQTPEVREGLEALAREGARRMLAAALEEEVSAFLGRGRYERGGPFRGYRNGTQAPREVTVGVGAVEVRVPRVAPASRGVGAGRVPLGDCAQVRAGVRNDPTAAGAVVLGGAGHRGLRADLPRVGGPDDRPVGDGHRATQGAVGRRVCRVAVSRAG